MDACRLGADNRAVVHSTVAGSTQAYSQLGACLGLDHGRTGRRRRLRRRDYRYLLMLARDGPLLAHRH